MVHHPLRQISGPDKADRLFQSVSAVQSGMAEWTVEFDEKQVSHLASWGARLHARMLGLKRGPEEDIGSFWMRIHRMAISA